MEELTKAMEILDKISFFGGQRAGRELWNDKTREVQDEDIASFNRDIEWLREFIRKHMNDGWIPVDERLPEELAPVLVTACVPVRKPGWDKRKECCVVVDTDVYDPEIKHGWEHFKDKVTAWMPLPEPYQREEAINEKE